ncbi:hypothetical protein Vretimale_9964 [Volvox reticuliferus]|uniref:Bifunctional lysine-specific demethylase and histidyl-hydroxylase n=1 Tax=Volvox reticuliferus TaxID=1737510 RepID=A0A8J4GDM2_9CHLO|nr:hypothetical protein Vretifemale_13733 [Volvox reticuliferus]GIM05477.1 hypothetical protein Vretimale_9964 [Volvox reticuliferus]
MAKKKRSSGEPAPLKEQEAAEVPVQDEDVDEFAPGPIDIDPLQFLIAPTAASTFTSEYWERKPLHIPANEERKKFFDGLFNFDELCKMSDALEAGAMLLMDQDPGPKGDALSFEDDVDDAMVRAIGPLMFGRDVVAVRYIDGERETLSAEFADSDTLRSLYKSSSATLQLHQPQRFVNKLWRLVAALEAQAGCLVGCNAYLTPASGQGLAPHHDDVELFVCQTQGAKKWRLYKPLNGFELPSKCSGDLPQEDLGDPILEVTMQPGDVLYVPRGTVHQAVAQEEGSCHLTISTYQRWTWGDLAGKLIETARDSVGSLPNALPLELRKGLPLGFIFKHGLQAELQAADAAIAARPDAVSLAAGLRALADQLEKGPAELLEPTADNLSLDFLVHRMPPHPCQLPDTGEEPGLEDSLVCRGKNLFRIIPYELSDAEDSDEDEDEEGDAKEAKEKAVVKLVTCLGNSRFTHMISSHDHDDESDDEEHDHEHDHDQLGNCCESDDEMEDEEDEEEGEAEEGGKIEGAKAKKGAKKAGKEEGAAVVAKEEEMGVKEAEKGAEAADDDKENTGEMAEIMEVDVDDEDSGDGNASDDSDEEGDDDDEEEEHLQGPVFSAVFAPVLAEILASTVEKPVPVKQLKVPGGEPQEQLRLARVLHEYGFVITVPTVEAKPSPEPKKGAAAAKKATTEEEAGEKKVGEEEKGKKRKKGTKAEEKGEEEKPKGKEEKGISPPAKKTKKSVK